MPMLNSVQTADRLGLYRYGHELHDMGEEFSIAPKVDSCMR